ncbi:MAG: alpha/beta hydrolase [Myxococcales bacterium]|nr:alpha/beta hydrolase [Myxococcales bacterium]
MVRVWRLAEPNVERLVIPLDTPGHQIALYHYPAYVPRWADPVILSHGLAANRFNMDFHRDGHGSGRSSLARYLARRGFDVWVLETRGHGHAKTPRRALWNAWDEVREDVPTAIRTVLDVTSRERVFWVGHSWGGLLQVLLQASGGREANNVAGVVALGAPGRFGEHRTFERLRAFAVLFRSPASARAPSSRDPSLLGC